ncbi:branched-chain amino acid ABC transporter permease [Pseudodonghicola flavimaris]|uniref:Branched-chain amino acid ABC transporter permease n=1 Tax=Pseudodonghicola flavimaris TaxID=3050036 RepID=A0ABT7F5S2_9RHOB|nr:branched-chain amino acid ABC transporter permease [Pseudodonghicola flavimaris]MDK3019754.1 branched-chain amino acid ABC transporter permease [Pseudodonghicola flavimaris]
MKRSPLFLALAALAVSVIVVAPLPFVVGNGTMRYMTDLFIMIAVAQLWNLLAGFGGVVSIGQHAFIGAGAYSFFGFTTLLGLHPFTAMALTVPFGALLSLPVFTILSRMRVAYFAIGSWVLAEVFLLTAGKLPGFGGGSGLSLRPQIVKAFGARTGARIENIYWLSFAILVLIVLMIILVMHSRKGYALRAMRDNENAAMALGVNPNAIKMMLFVVSGGLLSLLGALNTLQKLRVNPAGSFSLIDWTVFIIFIVVIGGMGRIIGPIIGAVLFVLLRENLANYGPVYMIVLGAAAIAMMLYEPGGLAALPARWRKRRSA